MKNNEKAILMLGCFDTKGEDFTYLYNRLRFKGETVMTIDTGVMESDVRFPVDFENAKVAQAANTDLETIKANNDRGKAVEMMGKGAARIITNLVAQEQIKGVIGMGGGGGTYIALEAMQAVPMGMPKFCISTLAAKDLSRQIGVKDVTLMVSSVDVAGLNSVSKLQMDQAAAAIAAMANEGNLSLKNGEKRIAISMFGNTTACVNKCTELLKAKGYEVLVFHATGVGGATMEALIREGVFTAVLDVTTTELADELLGGVLSAGSDRLTAASEMGIPQIVAPGCLDMVNFSQMDTVPANYKDRKLYSWSPDVTLMRTNKEEGVVLGKMLAEKVNGSSAPAQVLIPLKGISQIDNTGEIFEDRIADKALFESLEAHLSEKIKLKKIDAHINDAAFAEALVNSVLESLKN
ncbi:Tm-1-like ATP-binding domain-containing protein [Cytophaga sp. FL35]|uniref:Tm-1-like ATP-binding domain-containing protein n=1 Tax=Cytophaga sp. FL35 TaxID=1904456 RepID=UPI001653BB5F|nr:Tm-1-like ATP-binding domain-containing protein [Cytophaga sp. FL35]MBC6999833.1 Tm-1-like ATP-binding domain-containing protein [Cytophaga sp. FL35]